jgi:uncharacterized circularly permuted ATP-grasp superfamily protein
VARRLLPASWRSDCFATSPRVATLSGTEATPRLPSADLAALASSGILDPAHVDPRIFDKPPFNETGAPGECLPHYAAILRWLQETPPEAIELKRREVELLFRRIGITFAVYTEGGSPERLIPFDIIPRVLSPQEWSLLQRGLTQRVQALNAFIYDVYHEREILQAGKVPAALVLHNECFRSEMQGFAPPQNVYTHISGIDMVRVGPDAFYVLEDNCRTPSGVSYMLENREAMMRLFPDLYARHRIAPVSHYPEELRDTLRSVAPENCEGEPTIVLLTPGANNSAYYELPFSPTRWRSSSSKASISSSTMRSSICGRPKARAASMSSIAASMMIISIR